MAKPRLKLFHSSTTIKTLSFIYLVLEKKFFLLGIHYCVGHSSFHWGNDLRHGDLRRSLCFRRSLPERIEKRECSGPPETKVNPKWWNHKWRTDYDSNTRVHFFWDLRDFSIVPLSVTQSYCTGRFSLRSDDGLRSSGLRHVSRCCVCVCVCERERERERESVCVYREKTFRDPSSRFQSWRVGIPDIHTDQVWTVFVIHTYTKIWQIHIQRNLTKRDGREREAVPKVSPSSSGYTKTKLSEWNKLFELVSSVLPVVDDSLSSSSPSFT